MKKQYININDYQTEDFCLGVYGTLAEWRRKAMEWCDLDGFNDLYKLLKYYKIKNNELIDFINDFWDIEIVEYNQNQKYDFELVSLKELGY